MLIVAADTYEWVLAFHILVAVVWVGSNTAIQVFSIRARARRDADPQYLATFAADIEWYGTRVLIPSSLVLLGLGFWLVSDGPWEMSDFFVSFGLAVWFFSFLVGSFYLGPSTGRYGRIVAEKGPAAPEANALFDRIFLVSRVELGLLILVVLDMAIKPFL